MALLYSLCCYKYPVNTCISLAKQTDAKHKSVFVFPFAEKANGVVCDNVGQCNNGGAICDTTCKCPPDTFLNGTQCTASKIH